MCVCGGGGLALITVKSCYFTDWKIKEIVRENLFCQGKLVLSGKCHGILNGLKCGNPVFRYKLLQTFSSGNKKVLLRDRKWRTARGVASLALLPGGTPICPGHGYPCPVPGKGTLSSPGWGTPPGRTWDRTRVYPQKGPGKGPWTRGWGAPQKGLGTRDWGTPHVDRKTDACENIWHIWPLI